MPIRPELCQEDLCINDNGSENLLIIFGSAHGTFDFTGITEGAKACDVYSIRGAPNSWFENGNSIGDLDAMEGFIAKACADHPGRKILFGISMGGTAAMYFGSRVPGATVIAASPQLFQFQFLWSQGHKPRYRMVEELPSRLASRVCDKVGLIICSGRSDKAWNWRDREAAHLAEDIFSIGTTSLPCNGHEVWESHSMRQVIELEFGGSLFEAAA